jgi:membrane dipeptidase
MARLSDSDSERLALSARQREAHERALVIDLHVDCIIQQRLFRYDITREHDPARRWGWRSLPYDVARNMARLAGGHQPLFNQTDIPRMRRGGYGAAALTLHAWPGQRERNWSEIERQLGYFHEVVDTQDIVARAGVPSDVRQAVADDKLALFAAVEGAHCLGQGGRRTATRRIDRIEKLYNGGVRYLTLAHLSGNDSASSGYGLRTKQHRGLSSFGRELIGQMNAVGMIVDVAHLNHRCVMDACEVSSRPVIASHTGLVGAASGAPKRYRGRLLRDEAALAIAQTGGVVGVMLAPRFLCGKNASLAVVIRHLRYAYGLFERHGLRGAQHLAIGSDLDGWLSSIPTDIEDAADMPKLTAALLADGFTPDEVTAIWGDNFLRVWQHVLS